MNVRPKKHLGQHFLKNDEICAQIAQSISTRPEGDVILEIGPGTGALTKHLLQIKGNDVFVSEIDSESVVYLQLHYPELRPRILERDFLTLPLNEMFKGQVVVVGNFPYNISSQILFKVLDHKEQVPEVVGMFQKEVAMRVAGGPGTKDYGIISVFIQAYYDVEYLFTVDENEFIPPPKVKSGVIRMVRKQNLHLGCDEKKFKQVVKTAFNQRRKTMRNSLKSMMTDKIDSTDKIFDKRPEQLSVAEFVNLTLMFS